METVDRSWPAHLARRQRLVQALATRPRRQHARVSVATVHGLVAAARRHAARVLRDRLRRRRPPPTRLRRAASDRRWSVLLRSDRFAGRASDRTGGCPSRPTASPPSTDLRPRTHRRATRFGASLDAQMSERHARPRRHTRHIRALHNLSYFFSPFPCTRRVPGFRTLLTRLDRPAASNAAATRAAG